MGIDSLETDTNLYNFFEQHLLNYKNGLLSEEQKRRLSEYCLQEIFLSSLSSCQENKENKENPENTLLKYMSLGWYIYNIREEEEKSKIRLE